MKSDFQLASVLSILAIFTSCGSMQGRPRDHQAAATARLSPDVLVKLDAAMQKAVDEKSVSGIIGYINRNGKVGYFEAFGKQDIEQNKAMGLDAIFRLQSMSKPVVTVVALSLMDEGRFSLDEPISKHLPEWKEPQVFESGKLVTARTQITPRMLMSHSSGLYYGTIAGGGEAAPVSRVSRNNLETYSKDLAKLPLKFHPGTGYSYGTSIDILGRYIEVIAGKPLDVILKERVLAPLKMNDTDFWVPKEKADRIAQLYTQPEPETLRPGRASEQVTTKPTLFMGGQGLCSTTEDYAKFCQMLSNRGELAGKRILMPETVDLMFQNHLQNPGMKYGLGGAVDGEGSYTWGGANGTQFWIDRKNQLFAIFMVQTQRYKSPAYNEFRRLVGQSLKD